MSYCEEQKKQDELKSAIGQVALYDKPNDRSDYRPTDTEIATAIKVMTYVLGLQVKVTDAAVDQLFDAPKAPDQRCD